jgi:glutathionylspermidine synthase
MRKRSIINLPNAVFQDLGWDYFISEDAADYLTTELVQITPSEQEAFFQAGNTAYELMVETAEYVLRNNLLDTMGIPENLHRLIRHTWEDDRQLHLYGRFDFAGGTDGLPIKLLEFNADTATSIPETAIIQWAQLRANGIGETMQFNYVFEALTDNFRRLQSLNPDREAAILFSTLKGAPEDDHNAHVLEMAAREAGFETAFCYADEVIFSEFNGIFAPNNQGGTTQYPYWFKLIPWEFFAWDEPELLETLTRIVERGHAMVLNPAYTMLFQSKAILAYAWSRFKDHPILLACSLEEPIGMQLHPFVEKVVLGREGANVAIFNREGIPTAVRDGHYANQPKVYQRMADMARDVQGHVYQAGVFFAYESCGLGFRRSKHPIIDNAAQFVGHMVEP